MKNVHTKFKRGDNYMKKTYGLTNTELQIMELLWKAEEPMTFREIMSGHWVSKGV